MTLFVVIGYCWFEQNMNLYTSLPSTLAIRKKGEMEFGMFFLLSSSEILHFLSSILPFALMTMTLVIRFEEAGRSDITETNAFLYRTDGKSQRKTCLPSNTNAELGRESESKRSTFLSTKSESFYLDRSVLHLVRSGFATFPIFILSLLLSRRAHR